MATTKIEWADRTWNPITGCTEISEGCANCYAKRMSKRLAGRCGYDKENPFQVTYHENRIHEPANWNYYGHQFVFCGSMGDMFHQDVTDEMLDNVFSTMAIFPEKTFMVLTKRSERMQQYFSVGKDELIDRWTNAIYRIGWEIESEESLSNTVFGLIYNDLRTNWPAKNIWLGVTVENQEQADKRILILTNTIAAKHFVSVEPMLSGIDLSFGLFPNHMNKLMGSIGKVVVGMPQVDWVICGGETGPKARPMHIDWVRSLRNQCENAKVPFFFKGWGNWSPEFTNEHMPICNVCGYPRFHTGIAGRSYFVNVNRCSLCGLVKVMKWEDQSLSFNRGKKATGDLLDGKQYHNRPNK